MDFTEKAAAYIQLNNMLAEGDAVCAGVSGGADSVCLLLVLKDLAGLDRVVTGKESGTNVFWN